MSILGLVVRVRAEDVEATEASLRALPGVDVAAREDAADGRLVIVIEDTDERTAAARMAEIALWPRVINTSLVYEYSGPDAAGQAGSIERFADWRKAPAPPAAD